MSVLSLAKERNWSRWRWGILAGVALLTLGVLMALGASGAGAYESYHDPNENDIGYCTSCHSGFAGGRSDTLHALHTGGTSALGTITSECSLCHTGSGRGNPLTMWATGDADDGLGCAGCHGRDYGETNPVDYQGFPTAGLPKAGAWGLRDHHADSGIGSCVSCHGSTPPGGAVQAENIAPPYYARTDVLGGAGDPCADLLDNDGDGDYDADDSDCSTNVAPAADANGPYSGTVGVAVTFDGSASTDSDGTIVSYDWDFGDGSTGTGVNPTHAYTTDGTYTVSLTVTDNGGLADTTTSTATIDPVPNVAPTADANGPYTGTAGVALTFDGSGSSDSDGTIVSFDWDFGDGGTGTSVSPSHTYAAEGTFTVSLTVTDDGGLTDTATSSATIDPAPDEPPTADANGPYGATVGTPIVFDGSASVDTDGTIASYDWDFGDGGTGTGVAPTHAYAAEGGYTVSLTVTDDAGATGTATSTATITLTPNIPPTADANGPYTGTAGVALTFDGSGSSDSDGTIASYDWDFGDGGTGTGMMPSHTYAAEGNYTVTLTVTDDGGETGTATSTATIAPAPNVPPTADANGSYTGTVGVAVVLDGSGSSDSDGTIVSFDWDFGDGSTGSGVAPSHMYIAEGTYTVSLTVTDDDGATDTASSTADIGAANVAPSAHAGGPYTGTAGAAIVFDGSGSSDSDGSIVSFDWDFGDGGTGTGVSPSHVYAAAGTFTVSLTVTDDGGLSDEATATATIDPAPNAPPTAVDDSYSTSQGATLTVAAPGVLGNDSDADDDPITALPAAPATHGSATLNSDGSFTYTPDVAFVGTDFFTYYANDGAQNSGEATVTITVSPAGTVQAVNDSYTTAAGVTLNVVAPGVMANDLGGSNVWAFVDSGPTGGSLSLNYSGSFTYTPNPGFTGTDSFTYDFWDSDALKYSNIATVTIEVGGAVNVAPTADAGGPYSALVGVAISFDGSGSSDSDGSIVSYGWDFGDGSTGAGETPMHAYAAAGTYTVTLMVTDDGGLTDSDTASAMVSDVPNVAPTADAGGPYSALVGVAISFDGSGSSDSDGSIVSYGWDFGDGSTGAGETPMHAYAAAGTYTVTLMVTDDGGMTGTDTASVAIGPIVANADLDINAFMATRRVKLDKFKPVKLTVWVANNGTVDIPDASYGATATIVGVLNRDNGDSHDDDVIFSTTFPIWDSLADGSTVFEVVIDDRSIFSVGTVEWTATLDVPGDDDVDRAVAYTDVTERRH